MTILVNGKLTTQTSALDRGLLYGQTVFETIAVVAGRPSLVEQHLERLESGVNALGIPLDSNELLSDLRRLEPHYSTAPEVLRVTISMGGGGRGYQNPESPEASRVLSLHPYPKNPASHYTQGIVLGMSDVVLAHQPLLAGIKHGNRLEQVLARSQWQPGWHEAILCDVDAYVVEGTQSNVVAIKGRVAYTPILDKCGVEGVMKKWLLAQLKELGFSIQSVRLSVDDIREADEVLLTNSIIGVWPVRQFERQRYSNFETAQKIMQLLQQYEIIPTL